jgi:glycosyltransferase involved in cell wall biosynthesis
MSVDEHFPGKVGLQQRVLPAYRAPFFEVLAEACVGGLSVWAGQPRPEEAIVSAAGLEKAQYAPAQNRHFLHPGHPLYACWQPGLLDWLAAWQPQVLVVEANPRYRSTPAAVRWMQRQGRPVIGWGLGAPPAGGPLAGWRQRSRAQFLGQFQALIAYSQRGAEQYRAVRGAPERVFVAQNAVARRPTEPPPTRPPGFEGRPSVLFVGRLQARKRLDNLLQACAGLPGTLQPRLVIVGDGPERPALQALARTVYPAAEFPGAHTGAALTPFLAAADLFVLPGTGGLAVQQAMAAGLPVIVAEGDGTQGDLVRPGNGWLVPPDDGPALQAALQTALADAGRLRQLGAESYRIVAQEVNLEAMVQVFVQAFQAVVQSQGGVR